MSLVGASDHWMFISSTGALTAGRRNADLALFPYGPDDQISSTRRDTGSITLVRMKEQGRSAGDGSTGLWEPFAPHAAGADRVRRNIYKTPLGNKLVLEEVNESRQLVFRYRWAFSERFGFVRSCRLENIGREACVLELLDGLQNVLPYGVGSEFLMRFSNLANAYKKSELVRESSIGLFYLSSIPTDRAEPSEGLKSTTVWQTGLTPAATLLSRSQIQRIPCRRCAADRNRRTRPARSVSGESSGRTGSGRCDRVASCRGCGTGSLRYRGRWTTGCNARPIQRPNSRTTFKPASRNFCASSRRRTESNAARTSDAAIGISPTRSSTSCGAAFRSTISRLIPANSASTWPNSTVRLTTSTERFSRTCPRAQSVTELRRQIAELNDPNLTRLGIGVPAAGVQPSPWRSDSPVESIFDRSPVR